MNMTKTSNSLSALLILAATLSGCSGGGNASGAGGCDGSCGTTSPESLTAAEVDQIISQAVFEAQALGALATIAVTDRVGNVLGVFRMAGADTTITATTIPGNAAGGADGGLEGLDILPDSLAAISKAVTGAYLASEGNAFTTRTASQIVQDHFNPGELRQPGGPLFGVQFSQLPCSDFSRRDGEIGPQRSPLGLSADPGGIPLYQNGVPVGGIGVISDGEYSLDPNITGGLDRDQDELIALAGTFGFAAPIDRRADRITVDGKVFRFTDVEIADLSSNPASAPAVPAAGTYLAVPGYIAGAAAEAGTAFGTAASGVRAAAGGAAEPFDDLDGFVLVDGGGVRFPPTAGTAAAGDSLTAAEVTTILREALKVANRARAQIRRPLSTPARVSMWVVDANGDILGMVRGRDAPVFGLDVALQKARTATLFSSAGAAAFLNSLPDAGYLEPGAPSQKRVEPISQYVDDARTFLEAPTALADGAFAFADRSGGNLSRPYFPDGVDGNSNGPFSKPPGEWSVFSTGLQLDLVNNDIIRHVAFVLGVAGADNERYCTATRPLGPSLTATSLTKDPAIAEASVPIKNGIQIFPGSVPIYRGSTLIGGIGVSGDGIDQDDMISFLGLHNAGLVEAAGGNTNPPGNAPPAMRADNLLPRASDGIRSRLRFISCPQSPFIDSNDGEPCDGK